VFVRPVKYAVDERTEQPTRVNISLAFRIEKTDRFFAKAERLSVLNAIVTPRVLNFVKIVRTVSERQII